MAGLVGLWPSPLGPEAVAAIGAGATGIEIAPPRLGPGVAVLCLAATAALGLMGLGSGRPRTAALVPGALFRLFHLGGGLAIAPGAAHPAGSAGAARAAFRCARARAARVPGAATLALARRRRRAPVA
jgi:hypothetical protein